MEWSSIENCNANQICSNGKCDYSSKEQTNETIIYIKPNKTSGPIEIPNETLNQEIVCEGCMLNKRCYPLGYRKVGEYCSDKGAFVEQLKGTTTCDNNFECSTNLCIDNQCVSSGVWQKFLRWLSRLFGG